MGLWHVQSGDTEPSDGLADNLHPESSAGDACTCRLAPASFVIASTCGEAADKVYSVLQPVLAVFPQQPEHEMKYD